MTDLAHAPLATVEITYRTLEAIAETELVPKNLRGRPHACLAVVLLGREAGLGEMASLQHVEMIDGRPSLSTEIMVALVRDAGHSLIPESWTAEACTVVLTRGDNGDRVEVEYTLDDARTAGLLSKRNWQQHPRAMLWARAAAQAIRAGAPDAIAATHAYTPDDLGSDAYVPGDVIELEPAAIGQQTSEALEVVVDNELSECVVDDAQALDVEDAPNPESVVHDEFSGSGDVSEAVVIGHPAAEAQAAAALKADLGAVEIDPDTGLEVMTAADRELIEAELITKLGVKPTLGHMGEVESRTRSMIALAERLGYIGPHPSSPAEPYTHYSLRVFGVKHVSDLKRAQLDQWATGVRQAIEAALMRHYSGDDGGSNRA